MQNKKCVKDEPHSEFTKEEQQEFLNLLNRITPEQREALKKVLKSFIAINTVRFASQSVYVPFTSNV